MKTQLKPTFLFTLLTALLLAVGVHAQTTAFTYQGRLMDNGAPANGEYDLTFRLHDALAAGNPVGAAVQVAPVTVANGVFTVTLDFGSAPFIGFDRWLEIGVRPMGHADPHVILSPRQAITSTPYATFAGGVNASGIIGQLTDSQLSTTLSLARTFPHPGNQFTGTFTGNGSGLTGLTAANLTGTLGTAQIPSLDAAKIATGTFADELLSTGIARSANVWSKGGNAGTTPGTDFIGTTDNRAFEIKVNNGRAIRVQAGNSDGTGSPNWIGGFAGNSFIPERRGAVISGGGEVDSINSVGDNFATVSGGSGNNAAAEYATIGGGLGNAATANFGTVLGGRANTASGGGSTVLGGEVNTASGTWSVVPGGLNNLASGNLSLASGRRAQANHQGAFVWADSTDADFTTTADNQFLIRASGNVGINKNNPQTALDVNGTVTASGFAGDGSGLLNLPASAISGALAANQIPSLDAAKIATGTFADELLSTGIARSAIVWNKGGNAGTTPGTDFIGTTDNQALEIKVNNARALRVQAGNGDGTGSPNWIGGFAGNAFIPERRGAVISGGGEVDSINSVGDNFATVSGGSGNNAGAEYTTVGGGLENAATANFGTVLGGRANTASGGGSTVLGGEVNTASGTWSVVPGGLNNVASGNLSLAAGRRANASHVGAFVWADSTDADFVSTSDNQFLIRAGGNVGINKNNPQTALDVNGTVTASGFAGDGSGLLNLPASAISGALAANQIPSLDASKLTTGTIADGRLAPGIARDAEVWLKGGNAGTTPGTDFIGTTDNQSLEFKVNGQRALRLEPNATSPGIAGGFNGNTIIGGVAGAVIAGGGQSGQVNSTSASHSFIGSGRHNQIQSGAIDTVIGGGLDNTIESGAFYTVISGGQNNRVSTNAQIALIAGGQANVVGEGSNFGTISGGQDNAIGDGAQLSVIIGGQQNRIGASANFATVAGGLSNEANAAYALVAGRRAKANHQGAFVWADSTDADIASSAGNQFTVRASGGIRMFSNAGASSGVSLAAGSGTWASLSDRNAKENIAPVDGKSVLEKVAALPIAIWNYRTQDNHVKHVGPMAQDFRAAFGLGENETTITTVDADGVALAAIQGLNQVVKEKDAKIEQLEGRLADLEKLINAVLKK